MLRIKSERDQLDRRFYAAPNQLFTKPRDVIEAYIRC